MKVLTAKDSMEIVSFPILGGDEWQSFVGEKRGKTAVVIETTDLEVNQALNKAMKAKANEFLDKKDYTRDLKWLNKALIDIEDGTEIGLKSTGRAFSLDIPKDAIPDRAGDLAEHDLIAVGPNISPKALMNTRGRVVHVNGSKVLVTLDEGDRDRLYRSTGKKYGRDITLPKSVIEKVV